MNIYFRKCIAWFCSLFILILSFTGCHILNSSLSIKEIANQLSLTSELVECYAREDLLRIESICPGLDSYELTVALYSLSQDSILCEVSLGNGAWFTDWTDDGFYAADSNAKTITFYDRSGKMIETLPYPDQFGYISFLMVSPDKQVYFLGAGEKSHLYLYEVTTGAAKDVGQMLFGYQEPMTFDDGYFYLKGETDVIRIRPDAQYAETAYCLNRNLSKYPDMGISVDENIFTVLPSNAGVSHFIDKASEDEIPLDASAHRFIAGNGGNTAHIYDLENETIQAVTLQEPIADAWILKDWVLLCTNASDGHHLYSIATDALIDQPLSTHTTTRRSIKIDITESAQTTVTKMSNSGSHKISGVPVIPQMPNYPTGCESVSAVMALQYWGEDVSVDEFIDNYLPKSAYFHKENDLFYGPSPFEYFIGDPRSTHSYGCMAPVIEKALTHYYSNNEYVVNTTGSSLSDLCRNYIDHNIPVLVWATIGMIDTYTSATWLLEDGTHYGWPANEHCMVLIGYDSDYYYFNDPYHGQVKKYTKSLSETRYRELGNQSLVITK